MAVTKEQVFAAADQLVAAGQKPTIEAVRQITGGNYTTISPFFRDAPDRRAAAAACRGAGDRVFAGLME